MATETEDKSTTATEAAPTESPAAPAAATETPAGDAPAAEVRPRRHLSAILRELISHTGVQRLLAVVGSIIVFGAFALLYDRTETIAPPIVVVEPEATTFVVDETLTVAELVKLGEGAIMAGTFDHAEAFLDAARARANPDDTETLVGIYQLLAAAADGAGKTSVGEAHRNYAASLRLEMGSVLPLYDEAMRLLDEGKTAQARRYLASFLLRSGGLGADGKRFVDEARRNLAKTWSTEIRSKVPSSKPASIEPERYFDD